MLEAFRESVLQVILEQVLRVASPLNFLAWLSDSSVQLIVGKFCCEWFYTFKYLTENVGQIVFKYHPTFEVKRESRAKFLCIRGEFFSSQLFDSRFKRIYFIYSWLNMIQFFFIGIAQHFPK